MASWYTRRVFPLFCHMASCMVHPEGASSVLPHGIMVHPEGASSLQAAHHITQKPVQKVPAVYKIAQQKNPVTAFFVFSFVSIICIRFKGSKPTGLLSGHPASPLFLMFDYTIVSFSGQEFPAIFSHNSHNFAVFSFHTKLHTLSARVRNKSCAAQTLAKHFLIFSFLFRKTVV